MLYIARKQATPEEQKLNGSAELVVHISHDEIDDYMKGGWKIDGMKYFTATRPATEQEQTINGQKQLTIQIPEIDIDRYIQAGWHID